MKERWSIVKDRKIRRIRKPRSMDIINDYLDKGYVVSRVIEEGNNTKIMTYSPRSRPNTLWGT